MIRVSSAMQNAGERVDEKNAIIQQRPGNNVDYREQLVSFYRQYNPSKLDNPRDVEDILSKYKGQEELMMQRLEQKYCPSPSLAGFSDLAEKVKNSLLVPMRSDSVGTVATTTWSSRRSSSELGFDGGVKSSSKWNADGVTVIPAQPASKIPWPATDTVARESSSFPVGGQLSGTDKVPRDNKQIVRESSTRHTALQAERDTAVARSEQLQIQLVEALEGQYALAAQLDSLLRCVGLPAGAKFDFESLNIKLSATSLERTESVTPILRDVAVAAARAEATASARKWAESESMIETQAQALRDVRAQLSEAESRYKEEQRRVAELEAGMVAAEEELDRRLQQVDDMKEKLAGAVAESERLQREAETAAGTIAQAAFARDALLSFCMNSRAEVESRAAARERDAMLMLQIERDKLLALTAESDRIAAETVESVWSTANLETERVSQALLVSKTALARREAELRHELRRAASELAAIRLQAEEKIVVQEESAAGSEGGGAPT